MPAIFTQGIRRRSECLNTWRYHCTEGRIATPSGRPPRHIQAPGHLNECRCTWSRPGPRSPTAARIHPCSRPARRRPRGWQPAESCPRGRRRSWRSSRPHSRDTSKFQNPRCRHIEARRWIRQQPRHQGWFANPCLRSVPDCSCRPLPRGSHQPPRCHRRPQRWTDCRCDCLRPARL
jgi:hypothetical protein